jgi:hypothetical protein
MNIVNATTAFDENPATRAQIAQLIETIGRPDFASTCDPPILAIRHTGETAMTSQVLSKGCR